MDYKLQPLTLQQTNWPPFIEMYQELFDVSPTRVLDSKGMKLDKPQAFKACLDEHFSGNINHHLSFSFIGTASMMMLMDLANCTDIDIISKESTEERNTYIFVATASLSTWEQGIAALSNCGKNTKALCEGFAKFLRMAGFR